MEGPFVKRVLIEMLMLSVLLLAGCADSAVNPPTGSKKALLPWADAKGNYHLKSVQLEGVTQFSEFKSKNIDFYFSPGLSKSGHSLAGDRPHLQYLLTAEDQLVPLDQFSTEVLSVYAHLTKLQKLERKLGFSKPNKKMAVGVSVKYVDRGKPVTNNAMYVGQYNALLIVPYSNGQLPISLNAGVIAHEYFHSMFYREVGTFLKQDQNTENFTAHAISDFMEAFPRLRTLNPISVSEENELYEKTLLRGLNEGLADYWGYLYSGDPRFIEKSLSQESGYRRLDVAPREMTKVQDIEDWVRVIGESRSLNAASYRIGTQFARKLFAIESKADPFLYAKTILTNLPIVKERILEKRALAQKMSPSDLFFELVSRGRKLPQSECEFWKTQLFSAEEVPTSVQFKEACQ